MKPKIYLHFEHVPVEEYDISLANKLLMWESITYLNQLNGKKHHVYVEKEFYEDLDNLVFFPETEFYQGTLKDLSKENKNLLSGGRHIVSLSTEQVKDYFQQKKTLDPNCDYYVVFTGVQTFWHFELDVPTNRPFFDITFHNFIYKKVRDKINNTDSLIAIHVRRGDGVDFLEDFFFSLSEKTKTFVKKGFYKFYDDSYYHPIMEKLSQIYSESVFYVAHDLGDEDMAYWKDIFHPHVKFTEDLFGDVIQYFHEHPRYVITAIIDFLVLLESNVKILNPESTFSGVSREIHDSSVDCLYILTPDDPSPTKKINNFINQFKRYLERKNLTFTK